MSIAAPTKYEHPIPHIAYEIKRAVTGENMV